jgi:hypothetical protein
MAIGTHPQGSPKQSVSGAYRCGTSVDTVLSILLDVKFGLLYGGGMSTAFGSRSSTPSGSSSGRRRSPLVRIYEWLLDPDGDIYGDERSRFHWYEAIAAVASLQWILVPWALAIVVWFVPTSAIWALVVVFAVQYVLTLTCLPFLKSRNVNYARKPSSRKARILQVVSGLPLAVFVAGATFGADIRSGIESEIIRDGLVAGLIGGTFGAAFAWRAIRRTNKKFQAREAAGDDE